MHMKALLFGDLDVADEIMGINLPESFDNPDKWNECMKIIKDLGRKVRGFDQEKWDTQMFRLSLKGIKSKFLQNPELAYKLVSTGDATLVEAAPYDKIWGIGMSADDPDINDPVKWKGKNILGILLMEVRKVLIEDK